MEWLFPRLPAVGPDPPSGTISSVIDNEPATDTIEEEGLSWREQAVARSLDSARLRAESRVQRFLDAAVELSNSRSGKDFTVQEVVELSGQSLHSFYQYFGGKHELLLALIEETVSSTTDRLREEIAEESDSLARLHRFVVEYYRFCRPTEYADAGSESRVHFLAEFVQQLLTEHPTEAARVFSPLASLFEEVLDEAAAAGSVRPGLRHGPIVGIVLEVIMFNAFSSTIGGLSLRPNAGDTAEDLWNLILHGIGTDPTS